MKKIIKERKASSIIEFIILVVVITTLAIQVVPMINRSTSKRVESSVNVLDSNDITVVP